MQLCSIDTETQRIVQLVTGNTDDRVGHALSYTENGTTYKGLLDSSSTEIAGAWQAQRNKTRLPRALSAAEQTILQRRSGVCVIVFDPRASSDPTPLPNVAGGLLSANIESHRRNLLGSNTRVSLRAKTIR